MLELNIDQIEIIKNEVSQSDLHFSHLADDLIDHICCDVENVMGTGLGFPEAFNTVKVKIGFGGINRIQEETLLLINKKYRIMKKTMKIFGIIAPALLALAGLFKIQHWPGASILLTLGFFCLSFLFLPSAVYVSYIEVSKRSKKLAHISGFLAGFVLSISFLFKIQHWPGANIAMLAGIIIAFFLLIPSFFIGKIAATNERSRKANYAIGMIGGMLYLAGFLFKLQHWPGAQILLLAGSIVLVLIAFSLYVFQKYRHETYVQPAFIFIVVVVLWFSITSLLMNTNVSVDYIRGFYTTEKQNITRIDMLRNQSEHLFNKIKQNGEIDSVSKAKAGLVQEKSNQLVDHINAIEFEIVNTVLTKHQQTYVSGEHVDLDKIPNISKSVSLSRIMMGDKTVMESLNDQLYDYKNFMTSVVAKPTIDLASLEPTVGYNDLLDRYMLITTLNGLSDIREKILMVEYSVLLNVLRSAEKKHETVALQ